MKGKIFSPDEVNRMLPLVQRIADDVVRTYGEVTRALEAFEAAKATATRGEATAESQLREKDGEVAAALDRFQGLIEEIEALGGTVKDYERGLMDFYGEVDGEIVYLCWQPGETHLQAWHRLEEGFNQRRALPATAVAS
jgi:hypothetical protein